jgi:2-dehydropantoate 2-reductase
VTSDSGRELTVVGAGGVGGVVGAHLARAGHRVRFLETNLDHVEAIRERGLHLSGRVDFTVRVPVQPPDAVSGDLDLVLLAVKAKDTETAMSVVAPRLRPGGCVVSLQNGLEEHEIARWVGAHRTVGAFLTFGASYASPGEVVYGGPGSFRLGELDGRRTDRVERLAETLTAAFHPVEVTDNIFGFLWGKAALGAYYFATALVDEDVPRILDRLEYRPLFGRLVAEVVRVAQAEGVRCEVIDGFDPLAFVGDGDTEPSWQAQYHYWALHVQRRTGVWRDLALHRRATEVDHIIGPVIARAKARGVAVPLLRHLRQLIKEAEAGRRGLSFANLEELMAAEVEDVGSRHGPDPAQTTGRGSAPG